MDPSASITAAQSIKVVGDADSPSLYYIFVESADGDVHHQIRLLIAGATPSTSQKPPSSSIPETTFSDASSADSGRQAQDQQSAVQIENLQSTVHDLKTTRKEMQKQMTVLRQDRDLLQWRFEDLDRDVEEQKSSPRLITTSSMGCEKTLAIY
jgi:TolA-binding protein